MTGAGHDLPDCSGSRFYRKKNSLARSRTPCFRSPKDFLRKVLRKPPPSRFLHDSSGRVWLNADPPAPDMSPNPTTKHPASPVARRSSPSGCVVPPLGRVMLTGPACRQVVPTIGVVRGSDVGVRVAPDPVLRAAREAGSTRGGGDQTRTTCKAGLHKSAGSNPGNRPTSGRHGTFSDSGHQQPL